MMSITFWPTQSLQRQTDRRRSPPGANHNSIAGLLSRVCTSITRLEQADVCGYSSHTLASDHDDITGRRGWYELYSYPGDSVHLLIAQRLQL